MHPRPVNLLKEESYKVVFARAQQASLLAEFHAIAFMLNANRGSYEYQKSPIHSYSLVILRIASKRTV